MDYATLGMMLCDLARRGQVRHVVLADSAITQAFQVAKCHRNVERWIGAHPDHRAVAGWLITGTGVFVLHSVVDTGAGLLDITPRIGNGDERLRDFIAWPHPIDGLPSQVAWPG